MVEKHKEAPPRPVTGSKAANRAVEKGEFLVMRCVHLVIVCSKMQWIALSSLRDKLLSLTTVATDIRAR